MPHQQPAFLDHFKNLEDPRIDRKKLYPLTEILFIVLCASICGAQSWRDFVLFGQEKQEELQHFLAFEHGIPSKNTFSCVFASLNPASFKRCFIDWVNSFQLALKGVIALDGKTLRKSFDKAAAKSAIHMVSAFATSTKLVLGQQKVDDKSNEITAIPKLLDLLEIAGEIVTIDAMGTQKKIAKKIREKKADYVLALKGNHSELHDDIRLFLSTEMNKPHATSMISDVYKSCDKGHGRIEQRTCYVSDKIDWLTTHEQWCDLKSIVMIESQVTTSEKTTSERRYFISSLPAKADKIANAIRSHWAIENSLHWVLDVTLNEDHSRVRKDHAPENMAMLRHMTLNMLQQTKKKMKDISVSALQKKAGWGKSTLKSILMADF